MSWLSRLSWSDKVKGYLGDHWAWISAVSGSLSEFPSSFTPEKVCQNLPKVNKQTYRTSGVLDETLDTSDGTMDQEADRLRALFYRRIKDSNQGYTFGNVNWHSRKEKHRQALDKVVSELKERGFHVSFTDVSDWSEEGYESKWNHIFINADCSCKSK